MTTSAEKRPELPPHGRLSEPELLFHPERQGDRSTHPLEGLLKYGPYSRALLNTVVDPIRVAFITPSGEGKRLEQLISEAARAHRPKERAAYLRDFSGFSKVFGVRVVPAGSIARIELPPELDASIRRSPTPHLVLGDALTRGLTALHRIRHEFDVAAIYLPDRWQAGFWGLEGDDYDLHDYVKGAVAALGIPTQFIREDRALAYPCRCSVMWRIGIALYCKAGGTPWRLTGLPAESAYIGLSYALRRSDTVSQRFVSCCSQVFDADGTGFEFLVYSAENPMFIGGNPYLSRQEMHRVMARSLALYQRRNGGRSPQRVVVHKTTEFRLEEIDGCFDAFQAAGEVELIHVQQDSRWRGVRIEQPREPNASRGKAASYPVARGSYLPLSGRDVLLWTQGDAPEIAPGKSYYKEGKGIPLPLLLRRHAGHGGWEQSCRDILALTKMNWNNDTLYDRLPVTIGYSQVVAQVMKRMSTPTAGTYPFRLFM